MSHLFQVKTASSTYKYITQWIKQIKPKHNKNCNSIKIYF